MAAHMSHHDTPHNVEVHHLVLSFGELATIATVLQRAADSAPSDHQIHAILAACREGLGARAAVD